MQPVAARLARHRLRGEERTLQEDVSGLLTHRRAGSPHDAGKSQGRLFIGNHQGPFPQRHLLPIEQP